MPRFRLDHNSVIGDFHLAADPHVRTDPLMTPQEVDRAIDLVGSTIKACCYQPSAKKPTLPEIGVRRFNLVEALSASPIVFEGEQVFLLRDQGHTCVFTFQRDRAEVVILTLYRNGLWKGRLQLLDRWFMSPRLWRHGPDGWHIPLACVRKRLAARAARNQRANNP